jgi:predicted dehydrogenase
MRSNPSRCDRRKFLEDSMLATAAVMAVQSQGNALALDSKPEAKETSANEAIPMAVMGCRIRGKVHAQSFSSIPGVDIRYVCDPDRRLADALADMVESKTGKKPTVLQDIRRAIDDHQIKAISIAAPNHWHALAAIWAMQAGKDVYVEKPVSNTVQEGQRMVQVAQQTGRICQVGLQRRSEGPTRAAAEYVRSGKLGKLSMARTVIYGARNSIGAKGKYPIPDHIDFNLWLGPANQETLTRPELHYDWHWVWDTGNGELGNNNVHYIDMVRMMTGSHSVGQSVLSVGGRLGYEDAGETPNTQMVVHQIDGLTVIQEVRGLKTAPFHPKQKSGWIIQGTEGYVAESSLFELDGKLVKTFDGPSEDHFLNFIRAVRAGDRKILNTDIVEGHHSTALCHVGNISHRLGTLQSVTEIRSRLESLPNGQAAVETFQRMCEHLSENQVDLEKTPLTLGANLEMDSSTERFTSSEPANRLLARSYRKGFELPF